jgi:hypothetical protein
MLEKASQCDTVRTRESANFIFTLLRVVTSPTSKGFRVLLVYFLHFCDCPFNIL